MRIRTLVLALALTVFAGGCSTIRGWIASDAEKARGPAELTEIQASATVEQVWSINLGDEQQRMGLRQQVAIEGDKVFVFDDEGEVMAVDANTGKPVWRTLAAERRSDGSAWKFWRKRIADGGITGGPGVGGGLVVVGGRNGEVVALDAGTGAERWRAKVTSEVISAPLVAGDRVVVRSNDGRTFGLDSADGARRWVYDRGIPALSTRGNAAPVSDGQRVYLGYEDGNVVALRLGDGSVAWIQRVAAPEGRSDLDRMADVDGELALGYSELYATSVGGQTMAIVMATGQPLWSRDTGTYGGLALLADRLMLADPDGTIWALDRSSGSALWRHDVLARRWLSSPAVHGDYVVFGDVEGYLHWISPEDGRVVARERLDRAPIRGTPQVSTTTGLLFAISGEGKLSAYRLR
ncbi:outer membrane protein assembly factor BamB [Arenimonas fontis]|nr:outer membrane protein assembly factor BamB [Arenimonas fontis]